MIKIHNEKEPLPAQKYWQMALFLWLFHKITGMVKYHAHSLLSCLTNGFITSSRKSWAITILGAFKYPPDSILE